MSASPATPPQPEIREFFAAPVLASAQNDLFTRGKLLMWGRKSACSLIDQGLTSLTGFCLSFFLARWLAPEVYGAYAIAFAASLFVCGFHNVIVLEPMSVLGPARHAAVLGRYFRAQMVVHTVLVGISAAVAALVSVVTWIVMSQSPLAGAILGSTLALPFLLLLWLARRMCYVLQRPAYAMAGSAACLSFVLIGLYALRYLERLTPFTAFLLAGGGSLLGSLLILRQIRGQALRVQSAERVRWQSILRENWCYGRWLVGSTILYSISGQVQMFLVAGFLGLGSAGVLRAMMLPAAVMTQAVSATDLLILPGFSYDFSRGLLRRMRHKAGFVSCLLGGAGLCFAALLRLFSGPTEHLLFGGKFAPYAWLIPALALIPAANGFNSGFSAALRGSQKPHFDLLANTIAAPVALLSALVFIRWWGLAGAAASLAAGYATLAIVNFCSYRYQERNLRGQPAASAEPAISFGERS
jgi:O-antigen/teichoic acid export membrane protein